jgi:hypothetical protein
MQPGAEAGRYGEVFNEVATLYTPRTTPSTKGSARRSPQALCRTRTDDPFLTMEVLYQLS